MNQEKWLIDYIAYAFDGVSLGSGIDIHAAQSLDDYGNPEEDFLSRSAERTDWRRISYEILLPRFWAITFLDSQGFRFYTPAIMTGLLNHGDENGLLADWFLNGLKVTKTGIIKDVHFGELFNTTQRAAIIRFLKYTIHNNPCLGGCDSEKRLEDIQNRT